MVDDPVSNRIAPSEAYELGQPLGQFNSRSDILRGLVPAGMILFGLLIDLFLFQNIEDGGCLILIIVLISLFSIFIGVNLALRNRREGHWQVSAFEQGMILRREHDTRALHWADITSLLQEGIFSFNFGENDGIPVFTYCTYTIRVQSGEKYTFSGMRVEALGDLIENMVKEQIVARAVQIYRDGGTVRFGGIAISQAGVHRSEAVIPWADVMEAGESNGVVNIRRRGRLWGSRTVSLAKVENAFVIPEIVNQLTGIPILR